jgi:hypothetical protein
MPTITLEPDLYDRVKAAAQEQQASVDEVFAKAVQTYLWEQQRQKISGESRLYQQQHARLKAHFLGQYIAMHDGQVVDHDTDFTQLRRRIRAQYGRTAVMITRVEETPVATFTRRGFRVESEHP